MRIAVVERNDAVEEVGRVVRSEGIDCGFTQGGYVSLARNRAQWQRAQREVSGWRACGLPEQMRLLGREEARSQCSATEVWGATYTPHCAVVDPTRLVRGLADVVERLGVPIYEGTAVTRIRPRTVEANSVGIRADVVVRATEG